MASGTGHAAVAPGGLWTKSRGRSRRRSLGLTLVVAIWLIWLFDATNNLAPVRQRLAERDGKRILSLEQSLHLAPEHVLNKWLAGQGVLSQIVVFWYQNVHIAVTLAVLGWLWWRRSELLHVLEATLVVVNLIALAAFWSFPTAPPRMLPGGYLDTVAAVHHLPVWPLGATALDSNQLCSMPSLHIAWATACSICIFRISNRRWLRVAAVVYPFITTFAVMATANHYLADALAAAIITLAAFGAANRLLSPSRRRHPRGRLIARAPALPQHHPPPGRRT